MPNINLSAVFRNGNRVHAPDTAVAPATTTSPTEAEIKAWNDGLTAPHESIHIYYTGTDTDTDTTRSVFLIDAAGNVTKTDASIDKVEIDADYTNRAAHEATLGADNDGELYYQKNTKAVRLWDGAKANIISASTSMTPLRVGFLGTSLMDHGVEGTVSGAIVNSQRGPMEWAKMLMKQSFIHENWYDETVVPGWEPSGNAGETNRHRGHNMGVSGQTVADIKARIPDLDQYIQHVDIVFGEPLTNTVSQATTVAAAQAARDTLVDDHMEIANYWIEHNIPYVVMPVLGRGTTQLDPVVGGLSWASGGSSRLLRNYVNSRLKNKTDATRNAVWCDWNQYFVDYLDADNELRPFASYDGTHLLARGAYWASIPIMEVLRPMLPPFTQRVISKEDVYDANINTRGNLLVNPLLEGTGGAVGGAAGATIPSGDVADNMTLRNETAGGTTTCTATKEVRADGFGEYQVLSFSGLDAVDNEFHFRTDGANITTGVQPNTWYEPYVELVTNGSTDTVSVNLIAEDSDGSTDANGPKQTAEAFRPYAPDGPFPVDFISEGEFPFWPSVEIDGAQKAPRFLTKADTTILRWRIEVIVRNNTDSALDPVIKFGGIDLRAVDDPRFVGV